MYMAAPSLVFIVPYRDREQQQAFFDKQMKMVLSDRDPLTYKILYIHQVDKRNFNRGAMKNIGFLAVKAMYPDDYKEITLVFNDVDTMPYTTGFLKYDTRRGIIKHFYGFKHLLGGIVSITGHDFELINGFPNFWAWGYEDNLINNRALKFGLIIDRDQFYPIMDKNILCLMDGFYRILNRTEKSMYTVGTDEGFGNIDGLEYTIDDSTGFVNVTKFNTNREENISTTTTTYMSDALQKRSQMKMVFL